jgi:hypothetical protein
MLTHPAAASVERLDTTHKKKDGVDKAEDSSNRAECLRLRLSPQAIPLV